MYVLGFVFCQEEVLLVRKLHPGWQVGRFNGIGGSMEKGETAAEAMQREGMEEVGRELVWRRFGEMLVQENTVVNLFVTRVGKRSSVKQIEEEPQQWFHLQALPPNSLENLRWLVPAAYIRMNYDAKIYFTVRESQLGGRLPQRTGMK